MKHTLVTLCLLAAPWLDVAAQARFTSDTEMHHLGQIEWKRPTDVTYTITNTGDQPLVLTQVEPDCACTVAQWTTTPIAPGEKGEVHVTFDAEALGHFHKSVAIYTNAEPHLVYLDFDGEVVRELKDYTQTHPYLIGQIRIDRNELDFPDMHLGQKTQMHISVVNLADSPYEPVLMHLPPYLSMEVEPKVLQQGERGTITLTLDSRRLPDLGLTQTSVYLSRFSGDKVGADNEINVSAVMLPDFSSLTEAERQKAPAIDLSATDIDLSQRLSTHKKAKYDITLTNRGHSPLHISKLQVFNPAIGASLKKNLLQPGESTRLRITLTRRDLGKWRRHMRLLMVTNDPARPKVEINIKVK